MRRCAIGLAILALSAAGVAEAALGGPATSREGRWEYSLKTAYAPSMDFNGDHGTKLQLDDDLGWGFGFGYNASDQMNLGLTFGWRSIPYYATIVNGDNSNETSRYSNWIYTGNISLNGEYSILRSRFSPYASGSIGWTGIDTNISTGDASYACWWDPWYGYICSGYDSTYGTNALSYSLGAGMRLELSPEVFLRIGYEHGWLDLNSFDGADLFRFDVGLMP